MRILNRIIVSILSLLLIFSAVACGKDPHGHQENETPNIIKETEEFLVKDGLSDYKVVIPESPRGYEEYSAQELVKYFNMATSVELATVKENEVSVSPTSKLLILGETALAKSAGVTADKNTYGARGFVIKQIDSNVYIVGGDTSGTMYGVYEFMHHELGFEPYSLDEVALRKGVKNQKLLAFDMKEIPDIAYVQGIGPYFWEDYIMEGHRMRYNVYNEVFINATGQPWHNTFDYISPSEYNNPAKPDKYHPKWFTSNGKQLHYTAHGDKEELKALQDLVFEKIKFFVERDFAKGQFYEYIGFMHEDHVASWATSDAPYAEEGREDSVAVLKEKYGDAFAAAMLIQFINPIAERIDQYMDEKWDGRHMNITIFAYIDTEIAPVKEENGKIVPIDNDVKLNPNVNVLIAPIYATYIKDFEFTGMGGLFNEWSAIADQVSLWYYDYYFQNTMVYFDSTYSLQTFYQAAKDINAKYLFDESPTSYHCAPFGSLKIYLTSKLTWKVDQDVNVLVDNFFDNYFKDASGTMREFFENLRTHVAYLKNYSNITGVGASEPNLPAYWPEGVVNGFMQKIGQAYKDIEGLKMLDKQLYNKLYDRITRESLMPRFMLLRHYAKETYTDETFVEAVDSFKRDCKNLGISWWGISNRQSIEDLVFSR